MVFSSVQAYLDPSNWQQHQNHQLVASNSGNPLLQPQPAPTQHNGATGSGSIRPGSMSERARLANMAMPEAALKCPRCDSTNTKFCYFNNYSLSQPRHFCKTCRRYWTRGGALRSVPVGGGCRRNKRSKSTSSNKSPVDRQISNNPASTAAIVSASSPSTAAGSMLGLTPTQLLPPLRFMSPLSQFTDCFNSQVGLHNYTGITAPSLGTNNEMNTFPSGGVGSLGGIEPWRMHPHHQIHQFPFLSGFDPSAPASGIFQFQGGESEFIESTHEVRPKPVLTQLAPVKMEDNHELNLSRQLLGGMPAGNEHWNTSGGAWTEISSFRSSSNTNPL